MSDRSAVTVGVSIERALTDDLPGIAALAELVWRAHYPGIITHEQIDYMLARMYAPETLRDELESGRVQYLKLMCDGAMVGFAAFGQDGEPHVCKLHKLYLHPDHQRRGLGGRLLGEVSRLAKSAGSARIHLQVNKRNTSAIEAYRRNGYRVVHEAVFDIGGGFVMDDFIMEKSLAADPAAS